MKLALLGAGQLGGSLALALKETQSDLTITLYDNEPQHTALLQAKGVADTIAPTPEAAVADADIVMFATPLSAYRALVERIAPALKPGAIVTDMGSVKGSVAAFASNLGQARLVPAHPISGSEKSGAAVAKPDLFRNRLCILTPSEGTDDTAIEVVSTLWHAAGADVIQMPTQVHDQIYAYVSHLPHYIAFVAAAYFHRLGIRVTEEDATLHQFLRISRSNPLMWRDIALHNREMLLPVLATYIALLEHFATELRAGDAGEPREAAAIAKSYLPRILAASLISAVSLHEQQSGLSLRPFGSGGMRDIVAPAANAPEADMEAISAIAPQLADHIDAVIGEFRMLERMIGAEDADGLLGHIRAMVADAEALVTPRS